MVLNYSLSLTFYSCFVKWLEYCTSSHNSYTSSYHCIKGHIINQTIMIMALMLVYLNIIIRAPAGTNKHLN